MTILTGRRLPLAAVTAVAFLAAWTPTDDGPTLCPFALLTGHACPGCGMTRALASLLKGDWERTVFYHPLAPAVALAGLVAGVWWWGRTRRGWSPPPLALINWSLAVGVVLLVGVWLARALTGTLPPV